MILASSGMFRPRARGGGAVASRLQHIYGCLQDVLAEVFLPASEAFLVCGKVWATGIQTEEPICHLEGMTLET